MSALRISVDPYPPEGKTATIEPSFGSFGVIDGVCGGVGGVMGSPDESGPMPLILGEVDAVGVMPSNPVNPAPLGLGRLSSAVGCVSSGTRCGRSSV